MIGKTAQSFEDLHIYQRARELANAIYTVAKNDDFASDLGLVDQICRAAVSVFSNIAEGFERGNKTEFIRFLYNAKGACGKVRAQLQIAQDLGYLRDDEYQQLYDLCKQISSMILNLIDHLQKTDYQNEKFNRFKRLAQQKDKQRIVQFFTSHGVNPPVHKQVNT